MNCLVSLVYQKRGYIEIVGRAAEQSMRAAVEEVQALPEYSTKNEVHVHMHVFITSVHRLPNFSGSSLMHDMILQPMPTTPLSLACLEGI